MSSPWEQYNAPNPTTQIVKPPKYVAKSFFDETVPFHIKPQDNSGAPRQLHRPIVRAWPSSNRKYKGWQSTSTFVHKVTSRQRPGRTRQKPIDQIKVSIIVAVLRNMDVESLVRAIKPYYTTGRRGYDLDVLFIVHICRYLLDVERMSEWLIELVDNPVLAEICGVRGNVPSEATMSRFNKKLSNIQAEYDAFVNRLVEAIANRINELHNIDPERYPPVAAQVAIDATAINAWSNVGNSPKERARQDKDSAWGMRHLASNPGGGMVSFFGYKNHAIVDANYEFPIAWETTPGNRSDIKMLRPLYESAKASFQWFSPQYLSGDKGYDSKAMHRFLRKQGTEPLIAVKKPTAKDGLYDGLFNEDGDPTCMGAVAMEFVETDPVTKRHLYRCREEGCRLKTEGLAWQMHCNDKYWFDPDDNPRVMGNIRRNSKQWKRLYRKRWSVERVFASLKESRLLENHRYRGIAKVRNHVTSAVVAFLATMLAHLRQDDVDHMAFMNVRRA